MRPAALPIYLGNAEAKEARPGIWDYGGAETFEIFRWDMRHPHAVPQFIFGLCCPGTGSWDLSTVGICISLYHL